MELLRALAVFAEPPGPSLDTLAVTLGFERPPRDDEFVALFEQELPPFASLYVGPEGGLGGEAADRVAGFWRALGSEAPAEPDHLTTALALYAGLAEWEAQGDSDRQRAAFGQARAAFLWEHLLSWLPVYLAKVEMLGAPTYVAWAATLRSSLTAEAARTPMATLPLHLREAPGLPAPDSDAEGWVDALLTPVRAGLIVTRRDLARAAADLGLAVRAADRRAALRSLFAQSPSTTSAWLATEARAAAARTTMDAGWLGPVAHFWTERATLTAVALGEASQGS